MYCCIQSVAQFRRLRSNKAEENCFTLDSSYNHVFLTGNPLCQHAVVPVEDVVWMHSFMNDDPVPFERALFILRKVHGHFCHVEATIVLSDIIFCLLPFFHKVQ